MIAHTQTLLAEREDGHTADGLPGNCLQAAVASLLELEVAQVPHFALYVDWFAAMRRWARERDGETVKLGIVVPVGPSGLVMLSEGSVEEILTAAGFTRGES